MLHTLPTGYRILAARQESSVKAYLLTKNIEEFSGGKSQENGQVCRKKEEKKKEKKKDRKSYGSMQKNKRGDHKVESNDSPAIPDWGETLDVPGLLSGELVKLFFLKT